MSRDGKPGQTVELGISGEREAPRATPQVRRPGQPQAPAARTSTSNPALREVASKTSTSNPALDAHAVTSPALRTVPPRASNPAARPLPPREPSNPSVRALPPKGGSNPSVRAVPPREGTNPATPSLAPRTSTSTPSLRPTQRLASNDGTKMTAPSLNPVGRMTNPGTPAALAKKGLTNVQKKLEKSGFSADGAMLQRRDYVMGQAQGGAGEGTVPATEALRTYDGETPDEALTGRDVWKAVQAPVQSRPNARTRARFQQVLMQFAIAANPRYEPDGPGRPRGHIFVWDVSRAMGCEIPHFVGAKELSLAQTVDWVRHEGTMRGWTRTPEAEAVGLANKGHMVIALPKDPRTKGISIVMPLRDTPTGPVLCGAATERGYDFDPEAFFGTRQVEYFSHL